MFKKYFFSMIAFISFMAVLPAQADTLCPDPQIESSVVPSDLAQVQEDIDRLSLCVERTKLLQELNELANEKTEQVQPLNAGAFDPSFLAPLSPKVLEQASEKVVSRAPVQSAPVWKIRRVWGQGGKLQAQLIDSQGVLATVKVGEELTDGSVVETVSVRGVTVKQKNGKSKDLGWQESSDESL